MHPPSVKKQIILSFALYLSFISLAASTDESSYPGPLIVLSPFPEGSGNVFILTIDDLCLDSSRQYELASNLTSYLSNRSVPATFFAVPLYTGPYYFNDTFEIAQHGYSHINPFDNSFGEFENIPNDEVMSRLIEGKNLLEQNDYEIHGQRSPGISINKSLIPLLNANYAYDSSFYEVPANTTTYDRFIMPADGNYLLKGGCDLSSCNSTILIQKRNLFRSLISRKNDEQNPIIIMSHFFDYEYYLNNPAGRAYLDDFFAGIKSGSYWTTNMYSYYLWQESLESLYWTASSNKTHMWVEFNHCLDGLTFSTFSFNEMISDCRLDCAKEIEPHIQTCVIRTKNPEDVTY